MNLNLEVWKDIEGYYGVYQISNFGRVKSLKRTCEMYQGSRTVPEKILNQNLDKYGYLQVSLTINGKSYSRRVHRLIAVQFISNPENKKTINHINGIKIDNRIENLEWSTFSENNLHSCQTGLKVSLKGINHGRSKLTEKQAKAIKYLYNGKTCQYVAELYDIRPSTVSLIRNGKKWKHI